eukprot:4241322-Heterocapsa_arctica.AAC.1
MAEAQREIDKADSDRAELKREMAQEGSTAHEKAQRLQTFTLVSNKFWAACAAKRRLNDEHEKGRKAFAAAEGTGKAPPPQSPEDRRFALQEKEFEQEADKERARLAVERSRLFQESIEAEGAAAKAQQIADTSARLLRKSIDDAEAVESVAGDLMDSIVAAEEAAKKKDEEARKEELARANRELEELQQEAAGA